MAFNSAGLQLPSFTYPHCPKPTLQPTSSFPSNKNHIKNNPHLVSRPRMTTPKAAGKEHLDGRKETIVRPSLDFAPSIWEGFNFSANNQVEETYVMDAFEALKEQVRDMVIDKSSEPKDKMILIDKLELMGVAYHFEQEIDDQIEQIFKSQTPNEGKEYDLFTTAMHFRLFRQHGHDAPCGVFNKFLDDKGTFKKALIDDIKGLLSLYEATHLRCYEEDILQEANTFTAHYLRQAMPRLDSHLQQRIERTLRYPSHWNITRVETRYNIAFYKAEEPRDQLLLKFAKLDFNLLQNLYGKELEEIMRWWKELDLASQLPYIRDRIVESYFWALALNFKPGPDHAFTRLSVTRSFQLLTNVNDTYDSYATFDEFKMFLEIVHQRWDIEQTKQLSGCLQVLFKAIFTTYEDYDRHASKHGRYYAAQNVREEFKQLIRCYFKKYSWSKGYEVPTFEDIVNAALVDGGAKIALSTYLLHMKSCSMEAFEWLSSMPKIVESASLISRYLNDVASYKREHERFEFPNGGLDWYMKEHCVSKEEAKAKFYELADEAWMTLNREWISTKDAPQDLMELALNYARVVNTMYRHGADRFSDGKELKDDLKALFLQPIPIN